jgi:hypothetical protein
MGMFLKGFPTIAAKAFATIAVAATAAQALATLPAIPFLWQETTDRLEFRYGWPAEAEGLAALRQFLQRDGARAYEEARAGAAADEGSTGRHSRQSVWTVAGQSERVLSLTTTDIVYEGGAHENYGFRTLLWDRGPDRQLAVGEVLGDLEPFRSRFCTGLDTQRTGKRRDYADEAQDPATPDYFNNCPAIGEQAPELADRDHNGRFDTLRLLVAPYVAGPFSEGDYQIDVALTGEDVARAPDAFRTSLEDGTAIPPETADNRLDR